MNKSTSKTVKIQKKKSVLFVASEANPFVGTGGLADVIGSLPKALAKGKKYDVRVVLPLYITVPEGTAAVIGNVLMFGLPAIALIAGIVITLRRRSK